MPLFVRQIGLSNKIDLVPQGNLISNILFGIDLLNFKPDPVMPRILLQGRIKYISFSLPCERLFVTLCHAFVTRLSRAFSGFD